MTRREMRDNKIREEIKLLIGSGFKIKEAIPLVGDKFYLSPATIKDIWYCKNIRIRDKI